MTFRMRLWVVVLAGLTALMGCELEGIEVPYQPPQEKLAFSRQPVESAAGRALADVEVTFMDSTGALLHAPGTVTLTLATAPLGASLEALEAPLVHGVATFKDIALTRAGRYVFEARMGSLSVLSHTFHITAGAPGRLSVEAEPTEETVAGESIAPSIQVAVQDAYGNNLPNAGGEVFASLVGEGGTLSGTRVAPVRQGVATFSSLSVDRAGQYTLAFRYGPEAVVQSRPIRITPGLAVALAFLTQPSATLAGERITPAVAVALVDRLGNVASHASTPITLALGANPGGATLGGTLTVSAVQGVATFPDLSLQPAAEGYTLEATAGALPLARSEPFAILPAQGVLTR